MIFTHHDTGKAPDLKELAKSGPNEALLTAEVLIDSEFLLNGMVPLNPVSLQNLCCLIEASILHEKLITTINPDFIDKRMPLKEVLSSSGILDLKDTAFQNWRHQTRKFEPIGLIAPLPSTSMKDRINQVNSLLPKASISTSVGSFSDNLNNQIFSTINSWSDFSDFKDIQVYPDVLWIPKTIELLRRKYMSKELYALLVKEFKKKLHIALRHIGGSYIFIPPFAAIVLDRSDNTEDIPNQILRARKEFADLRKTLTELEGNLRSSETLNERYEIEKEFIQSWNKFTENINSPQLRWVERFWSFTKESVDEEIIKSLIQKDGLGVITKISKSIIDKLIAKYNEHLLTVKLRSFYPLWKKIGEIKMYEKITKKVFGQGLHEGETKFLLKSFNEQAKLIEKSKLTLIYS